MARPLPDAMKLKIATKIKESPFFKDTLIRQGKKRGYDMSEFEVPENTLADNAAAFMAGLPEGASWGMVDLPDTGKEAGSVDLPLLGEVQPAREAGRLLGGMVSGATLWKTGARIGVPAGKKVLDALIRKGVNPNSRALQGVGKLTEIGVAATPEALMGGFVAPIVRGEDADTLDESLAEWMALGVGSEILGRKVLAWRAKRKMQGNTPEVVSEGENLRREVLQDTEDQTDLRVNSDGEPDGPSAQLSPDEAEVLTGPETPGAWSSNVDQAGLEAYHQGAPMPSERTTPIYADAEQASRARSNANRRAVNRHEELIGDDHPWPDQNVTAPKLNWTYRGPGGTVWSTENKDLFTLNLSESNATKGYGKEVFVNQNVKLDGPVAQLRQTQDSNGINRNIIEIDEDAMYKLWQQPEQWTKGKGGVFGISPGIGKGKGHGDLRDSYDNFRTFVILHELEHKRFPRSKWKEWVESSHKGRELTEAAEESGALDPPKFDKVSYENEINRRAIRRYNALEPEVKLIKDDRSAETNVFAEKATKQIDEVVDYWKRTGGLLQGIGGEGGGGTADIFEQFPIQPQAGGEGLAPEAMLRELASLLTEVRRLDPQESLNSLNYIVPGIKVTDAQELIDHLKGVRTHAKGFNQAHDIHQIEKTATSRSFDSNEPPLPEYATIEVSPDQKRKSTGLMHTLFRKFWVPTSKVLGFGADPISTHAIRNTVDLIGRKQGIEEAYTKRLNEILEIVAPKEGGVEGVMTKLGQSGISDRNAMARAQFFNLMEDLNNYTPYGTAIENYPLMKANPRIQQAITAHKSLTNEIADELGLGKNRRMRYYVPHIFEDRAGQYAAASVSAQMAPDDAVRLKDLVDEINRSGSEEVGEEIGRGFRHLRGREVNFDGFEHDYQKIMQMYIRGATSKITNDKIARHINSAQSRLISEGQGEIAKDLSKYGLYAMGMPTDFRTKVATKFADSHLFNSTVDRLMTFVGGKDASVLTRAREAGDDATNEMNIAAREFMQEMHDMVRYRDRITGERTGNEKEKLKQIQAKLAKKLDDFRQDLNNPYSAASASNFLYRTQIIAKLGFNIAHGMINQTQTLTNTWPMLQGKNVAWGYAHSAFNVGQDKVFNGRTIQNIIDESGISKDVNRYEEFLDGFSGVWSKVQDMSMWLARYSEAVNRETALLGGYKEYVEAGMSHHAALHKARELVSKTQFPFNKAGTAPILRDPTGRLFLMFKSYPMHQTDFTIDLVSKAIQEKDYSALTKHAMSYAMLVGGGAYLLPDTNIGGLDGRTTPPAFDIPKDILDDTGRYSFPGAVAKNMSGPFGDTLTDVFGMITALIDGGTDQAVDKAVQAANSFAIPATVRRFYGDEIDMDDLLKGKKYDWLYFTGLKKYEPGGSGSGRIPGAIRPINPLKGLGLQ